MLVSVTYLEQLEPPVLTAPVMDADAARLVRLVRPSVPFVRFLYRTVGHDWSWVTRREWTDREWEEALARPEQELWVSWQGDHPTGFAELIAGVVDGQAVTNIKYLGLFPGFCGRRLGWQLLVQATRRAWTVHHRAPSLPLVERVVVDTCQLDNPQALRNYLALGFQVVEEKQEERPVSGAALVTVRGDSASSGP